MLENLWLGVTEVFQWNVLLGLIAGTVIGYFVGAMPGLSPSIGIALLVPFTFGMDPVVAMVMLISLYMAAEYGGAITAIVINTPGTAAAAATAFDGYPMAQRGEAGKALSISIIASAIGALISSILLIFTAIPMANWALAFGSAEYFALAIFGLSLVSSLSGKSLVKGFLAMMFGLLVAVIGLDPVSGVPRFAWNPHLFEGVPFLPALIGLFALSEVFYMLESVKEKPPEMQKVKGLGVSAGLFTKMKANLLRSSILGYIIGVIPGAGATVASFVAYNEAKRFSKNKDEFGKGSAEGLAACEAANNAAVAGTAAPLLSLGIPGSASAAILIGALTIQGIQPGPMLFTEHPEIPYSIFISLLVSVPVMLFLGLIGLRLWMRVTLVPKGVLAVLVAAISILGAYAYSNSMYPVWVAVIFGIIGYGFRKVDIPTAPIVLALVLGFMMEVNFRRAVTVSGGDMLFIFSKPIALILLILSLITLLLPIIRRFRRNSAT